MSAEETASDAHPAFSGPPASGDDSLVKVPASEYQRFKALETRLAELEAQHAAAIEAKSSELAQALARVQEIEQTITGKDSQLSELQAKAGDMEKALAEQRTGFESKLTEYASSYQAMRQMFMNEKLSNAAAAALAGQQWAGNNPEVQARIAAKARAELESMLETVEVNGKVQVRGKDGRPVADVARDLTKAGEFQVYVAPKSRGGSGTDGTLSAPVQHPMAGIDGNPHAMGTRAWFEWRAMRAREEDEARKSAWRLPKQQG